MSTCTCAASEPGWSENAPSSPRSAAKPIFSGVSSVQSPAGMVGPAVSSGGVGRVRRCPCRRSHRDNEDTQRHEHDRDDSLPHNFPLIEPSECDGTSDRGIVLQQFVWPRTIAPGGFAIVPGTMGNRRVRVMWCDLNGLSHGRYVPEHRLGEHGHHAVTTLVMNIERDILPITGYAADVGFPDLSTVPLVDSRRPGWEVDTDVVIADLEFGGEPLPIGPRNALEACGARVARTRVRADARIRDGVLRDAARRRCAGWLLAAAHPVAPRVRRRYSAATTPVCCSICSTLPKSANSTWRG